MSTRYSSARSLKAPTNLKPVQDQFYGDRSGFLRDPFGHLWGIATHVEDVSPEEMQERMKKLMPAA